MSAPDIPLERRARDLLLALGELYAYDDKLALVARQFARVRAEALEDVSALVNRSPHLFRSNEAGLEMLGTIRALATERKL